MKNKLGVLLINLGTPDAPSEAALREFLAEFLSDPYVVDFPLWLWKPILNKIILRVRPAKSAQHYQQIWGEAGSPLLRISQSITAKIQAQNPDYHFALGMRYGSPSIERALTELDQQGVDHLVVFPLFPQYSSTTSQTAIEHTRQLLSSQLDFNKVTIIEDYHDHPAYLQALAGSIARYWEINGKSKKLVFSFHGIPERYISARNEPYRQHCERTAEQTAAILGLSPSEYIVAYQSRFGPGKWLEPAADQVLVSLGEKHTRSVSVLCPGFAADCLETLEEIAEQGRNQYQYAGGSNFSYIPCLNDHEEHISALSQILTQAILAE